MRSLKVLEAVEGGVKLPLTFIFSSKKTLLEGRGAFFFLPGTYSLERAVVPFSKTVINLPMTYEKLRCKEEHIGSVVSKIHRYS